MSDDPQLDEVRGWYIDGRRVHNPFASDATLVARFDAWLAEYTRQVKAEAWDEGEQAGLRRADFEYGHATIQAVKRNPYREGQGDE